MEKIKAKQSMILEMKHLNDNHCESMTNGAFRLLEWMLDSNPYNRPSADNVLNHAFFRQNS